MTYHDFIAPCFDKYTPLPDGELRQKIEALAQSLSFPLKKLQIVEGSKRYNYSSTVWASLMFPAPPSSVTHKGRVQSIPIELISSRGVFVVARMQSHINSDNTCHACFSILVCNVKL